MHEQPAGCPVALCLIELLLLLYISTGVYHQVAYSDGVQ